MFSSFQECLNVYKTELLSFLQWQKENGLLSYPLRECPKVAREDYFKTNERLRVIEITLDISKFEKEKIMAELEKEIFQDQFIN